MKVWEKIKESFNDTKNMNREQIESNMYNYRYTPCDCESKHNFIGLERKNKLCSENSDCEKCLSQYLDMEVQSE